MVGMSKYTRLASASSGKQEEVAELKLEIERLELETGAAGEISEPPRSPRSPRPGQDAGVHWGFDSVATWYSGGHICMR